MPYLVGLTGGLASGKSTVGRWLAEAGFTVVDADRTVAELYAPGRPGAAVVAELFGEALLTADGAVDRERLAGVVFADPEARRRLESAIHPLVREAFRSLAARTEGVAVLEATLLVEAGFAPDFDLVVTVEADTEARLRRAIARGLDESSARARLAAQNDGAERRAAADVTLDNGGTLADLRRRVDELVVQLRAAASSP